jgi:hypothetical protein
VEAAATDLSATLRGTGNDSHVMGG